MLSCLKAWMLSFSSVEDVIIFHGVNVFILKAWMLSFSSVEDVIIFHDVKVIIFYFLDVIIFECWGYYHLECKGCDNFSWCTLYCMLSFLKHGVLSFFIKVSKCYHFRVLSFILSFGVIISFMLSFNVIIFWCYHLV